MRDILDSYLRFPFKNERLAPVDVNSPRGQHLLKSATSSKLSSSDWCRDIKDQVSYPKAGQPRAILSSELLVGLAMTTIEAVSLSNLSPYPIMLLFLSFVIDSKSTICTQIFISASFWIKKSLFLGIHIKNFSFSSELKVLNDMLYNSDASEILIYAIYQFL